MSATVSTTSEDSDAELTPLAKGLKIDHEEDSRSCPHECHGELELTEDGTVLCQLCRCTPDGVYYPPDGEWDDDDSQCVQYRWFHPTIEAREGGFPDENPHPLRGGNRSVEHYSHSGAVILVGGFEIVYNENDEIRPNGVTEEYTFDLTTY